MHDEPLIRSARVRLVAKVSAGWPARRRLYQPLVVGPAILYRWPGRPGPWRVDLACDRRFLPRAPRSATLLQHSLEQLGGRGLACRVGAAVLRPQDAAWCGSGRGPTADAQPAAGLTRSEIYGWALMYQPAAMRGLAFVDPDDRFDDLPACFELPEELIDRATHLEDRGIRTRPLAIVTRPEDFALADDGRWRNRFDRQARFRLTCGLDRLV